MTYNAKNQDTDALLNELMLENHITLKDVYHCAKQHIKEIRCMMNIFELKNERDEQLALLLIHLLSMEKGKEAVDFYCKQYHLSAIAEDYAQKDIELLITACCYNPALFSYARELCEKIKSKLKHNLKIIRPEHERFRKPEQKSLESDDEFVVMAAAKENMLDLALFTQEQRKLLNVSSAMLNLSKKYIRIAFQTEKIPVNLQNLDIQISKDDKTKTFSHNKMKSHFNGEEWIITINVNAWKDTFWGSVIKCVAM